MIPHVVVSLSAESSVPLTLTRLALLFGVQKVEGVDEGVVALYASCRPKSHG